MITAVDTNVLVDVFRDDAAYARRSAACVRRCLNEGTLVVCDVVWAELSALFPDEKTLIDAMGTLGGAYLALDQEAATMAGRLWRSYRAQGGSRSRVIADFLIGAHALVQCDRLLSRDRGFYGERFNALVLLDPSDL